MKLYLVTIEESTTGFAASLPDLPGCIATGATREEVEKAMKEGVEFHIRLLTDELLNSPVSTADVYGPVLPYREIMRAKQFAIIKPVTAKPLDHRSVGTNDNNARAIRLRGRNVAAIGNENITIRTYRNIDGSPVLGALHFTYNWAARV
jgi:predicted RNase H-like HicB family nuclease